MLATALSGLFMAGCSTGGQTRLATTPAAPSSCGERFQPGNATQQGTPAWIVTPGGLARLKQWGLPAPLLGEFNRPSTLLLVAHGRPVALAPRATLAYYFTSASGLETAVQEHRVPGDVQYLLLDLERWPLTPSGEQLRPIDSLRRALSIAHSAGKCVVFTPAVDLTATLPNAVGEAARFAQFDRAIAGPGSVSDVFEVQSQQTEGTAFATTFAPSAIAAVLRSRPGEPVFVGLSTNPDGRHVTPSDLLTVYHAGAAAGAVGYWLNIPETGVECPRCGKPQPQVAVAFLEALARGSQ